MGQYIHLQIYILHAFKQGYMLPGMRKLGLCTHKIWILIFCANNTTFAINVGNFRVYGKPGMPDQPGTAGSTLCW